MPQTSSRYWRNTLSDNKKIQVEFAPGCFDEFDGTQEELDALIAEIVQLAESGELAEQGQPLDIESFSEEELEFMEEFINRAQGRRLQ